MVKVRKEPEETDPLFRHIIESCCKCDTPTRYWYIPYNQPLCKACAKKYNIEDIPKNPYFPKSKLKKD